MSLRTRLLGAVAYVLLLAIVAFGVPLGLNLSTRIGDEVRTQALGQADVIAQAAGDLLGPRTRSSLEALARRTARPVRARVLIVDRQGRVLADSAGRGELGVSYLTRPEIRGALAGRRTQIERTSATLGERILATAVPILHDGVTAGAVRVTQSVAAVHDAVLKAELAIALIGLSVLALGLLAGAVLAGQIARPLRRLEAVARRVAQGDLRARAEVEGSREQRSLAGSFNHMTDRIAALLSSQQDFVADASHKLRTPLTGLRLRLEAARELSEDPEAGEEIDAAITEVDRLARTVDELLQLSRSGSRSPVGTEIDLRDLAADMITRWQVEAGDRAITLTLAADGAAGTVFAARADLERALDVLIENALHYSPPGSEVTVATGRSRVEVRDRGAGVASDERELVFERFRRGRAGADGPPGSGLGLPIARELAREWGADVTLEARRGGGTVAVLAFALGENSPTLPKDSSTPREISPTLPDRADHP